MTLSATAGSLSGPNSLAFDLAGNLWVANNANNTVVEFTPAQLGASGSPTPAAILSATGGSLDEPSGLAFGPSGNLWVANNGNNTVVEFTPAQLAASGSPAPAVTLSSPHLNFPDGLVFDRLGDLWVANSEDSTVDEFTAAQLAASSSAAPAVILGPSADNGLDVPGGVAFDPAGNLWVANNANNTVVEFTAAQLGGSGSPTPAAILSATGGSLDEPSGLAFGPAGDLWVANFGNDTVVEFTPGQLAAAGAPTGRHPHLDTGQQPGAGRPGLRPRRRPVGGERK